MTVLIPDITSESDEVCTIEATVVTGFEFLAAVECHDKLGVRAQTSRGRIVVQVPLQDAIKVLSLRSIDNVYVVIFNNDHVELQDEEDKCLQRISEMLMPNCQWEKGLKVFKSVKSSAFGDKLKFRVTCNRACGHLPKGKHTFTSSNVAKHVGAAVIDRFDWKADMTGFDVEVVVNITGSQVYSCITLTKGSLHRRNIVDFGYTTLRSTVAYNLLQLANIKDSDVVCDPMCGSGAIPIEGALSWNKNVHLCGDMNTVAVGKVANNVDHIQKTTSTNLKLDVFRWDICHLPLRSNSVDVFVTDMPFGKRMGSKAQNLVLYPKILSELARVSRENTGRAVLLTQDRKTMTKALQKVENYWKSVRVFPINLGGLFAIVYYLEKRLSQGKPNTDA